MLTVSTL